MIEKVPRIAQAAATVSDIARIRRAAIDRSLNMGDTEAPREEDFGESQKVVNTEVNCRRYHRGGAAFNCPLPVVRNCCPGSPCRRLHNGCRGPGPAARWRACAQCGVP